MKPQYNSSLLLEELTLFFKNSDLNSLIKNYKKCGWEILVDVDSIIIKTKKNTYHLGIIKKCGKYFWHLYPYGITYYQTEYHKNQNFLDKLLQLLCDNEKT